MTYTPRERFGLVLLAVTGFGGINGIFLWTVLTRKEALLTAMKNPIAAAFIVEALLMVGVLAYLLAKWQVSTIHWAWFIVLALIGSLAFALPVVLLWSEYRQIRVRPSTDQSPGAGVRRRG